LFREAVELLEEQKASKVRNFPRDEFPQLERYGGLAVSIIGHCVVVGDCAQSGYGKKDGS
jgi:hypothetical protein